MGLRGKSEKYGFVIPLHESCHVNGVNCSVDNWKELDHQFKRACQEYYMENYGTREDWYRAFGRFYDYEIED